MKPIVAIVGRPNVGKSTLFNKLTKSKSAIVSDVPGVTRDRNYSSVTWGDHVFTLVDTGGFVEADQDLLADQIRYQIHQAIDDADIILLVLDGKTGVSPYDQELIQLIRSIQKPIYYLINKIDGPEKEDRLFEFYNLGIDKMYPISAEHGYGIGDFLDDLVLQLPKHDPEPLENMIKIAVVGRPNVGKSSLINRLLGEDRLIVSESPGTTRDAVDTILKRGDTTYLFIDTAGIRKKSRITQALEKFSVIKSLKSIERCDVAIIVIDASEGLTDQDMHIAGYAIEKNCGCILVINKCDLIQHEEDIKKLKDQIKWDAKYLHFAPTLMVSALTGKKVSSIFSSIKEVYQQYCTRISTSQINKIISVAVQQNEPPYYNGKRIKYYYSTQISTKPPTFVCFVNQPEGIHFSYQRYLMNCIRKEAGLDKIPIRIFFRERTGRKRF